MPSVRLAASSDDVHRCFPVMTQLRPHLRTPEDLAKAFEVQAGEGYRLAFVEDAGRVVAVAGFRVLTMLHQGRFLYVDDLVTDDAARSKGYGALLLEWLEQEARREGCNALELDSGVQRAGAHRFYFAQGMHVSSYHFRMPLDGERPRLLGSAPRRTSAPADVDETSRRPQPTITSRS